MAYTRVTFTQLKTDGLAATGNPAFFTDAEIGLYVNEALRIWQLFTGYWRTSKTLTGQAQEHFYAVNWEPNAILKPLRVLYGGTKLAQESMLVADRLRPGWQGTAPGTPVRWFPVGISRIAIHPAPSVSGTTITVEGLARAPILRLGTDHVDLGEHHHSALLDYVAHLGAFKQGGAELATSISKYANFLADAGAQNAKFKLTSIYRRALGAPLDPKIQPVYEGPDAVRDRAPKTR